MPQDAEFPSIARAYKARRKLVTLMQAPVFLFYVAILLLLGQLLRMVRRAGPFTAAVARWVRFPGWFILGGYLAVTIGQSVAQGYFASTVLSDQIPVVSNVINTLLGGIFLAILIACGLLTLARMMQVGAQMNDDLAGTV